MANYKLYYFNFQGRAEVTRYLFAIAEVEYEDYRFDRDEWNTLRDKTPFGQTPWLETEGVVLSQSHSIERYLADKFGLLGKTALDKARVDMIVSCVEDVRILVDQIFHEKDENREKELVRKFLEEQVPEAFGYFEKFCKDNNGGSSGYFVGDTMTLADIVFYHIMNNIGAFLKKPIPESWDKWPMLGRLHSNVASHPKIKEWEAKRPETEM